MPAPTYLDREYHSKDEMNSPGLTSIHKMSPPQAPLMDTYNQFAPVPSHFERFKS